VDHQVPEVSQVLMERLVRQDHRDFRDVPALQDQWETKDLLVSLETMDLQDLLDQWDQEVIQEKMEPLDSEDPLAQLDQLVRGVHQAHQVQEDFKVDLDPRGSQDKLEKMERPDYLASLV